MKRQPLFEADSLGERLVADALDLEVPEGIPRHYSLRATGDLAQALIGMRRSGKTWTLYQFMHELMRTGVAREKLLYINFEDDRLGTPDAELLRAIESAYFRLYPGNRGGDVYLFLDEIQYVAEWPRVIRRWLDQRLFTVVFTGSSAKLLSREIATSMRGRALETHIRPYGFAEFIASRGQALKPSRAKGGRERSVLESEFTAYLEQGGFPGVVKMNAPDRRQMLQSYVHTVVFRDVVERHGVSNLAGLQAFLRLLFASCAQQASINKMHNHLKSQGLAIAKNTLHDYMAYFEDAFLFESLWLDTPGERRRMVNPRKIYAADHALVDASVSPGGAWGVGRALETAVYNALRKGSGDVAYARGMNNEEIDFRVLRSDGRRELIQVCARLDDEKTAQREFRSLLSGGSADARKIITLYDERTVTADGVRVDVIPAWRFLADSENGYS